MEIHQDQDTEMTTNNSIFLRWIKSWLRYNICFCKSAVFASGLIFSYKLAEKVIVSVFITYFTDYSRTSDLRKAAAFTNYQEGLSASLEFFMFYVAEAFSNHFMTLIFCLIVTYASGMGIFAFIASVVFPVSLFDALSIIGLTMVAIGRAGLMPFIRGFTFDQLLSHEPDQQHLNIKRAIAREKVWWRGAWVVGSLVSIPLFNTPWISRFKITASVMGLAFVVFMSGYKFYYRESKFIDGSRPLSMIRVIKAAFLNRHFPYPEAEFWPQVKWLRCLDKAVIIEPTLPQNEQQMEGRLVTEIEVQESKYILKMVPMWCAFPVFGLVLSAGNTFFAEQAIDLKFPNHLIYLILLQSISRVTISSLSTLLLSVWYPNATQKRNLVKIWAGMLISILLCVVAWKIESHRLDVAAEMGLLEYPFKTIPMSIWWLAPQFCMLGLMEGLAVNGLEEFTIDDDNLSLSIKDFLIAINGLVVIGAGSVLNILFVYPNNALFGITLNFSRLDLYFKYLAYYGPTVNISYLLCISLCIYGSM